MKKSLFLILSSIAAVLYADPIPLLWGDPSQGNKGKPHSHLSKEFNQYLYNIRLLPLYKKLGYDYVDY